MNGDFMPHLWIHGHVQVNVASIISGSDHLSVPSYYLLRPMNNLLHSLPPESIYDYNG